MKKFSSFIGCLLTFCLHSGALQAQPKELSEILAINHERVYLHLDKYDCIAGDTLWFRAYITESLLLSSPSTTLYLDLFNDSGRLIRSQKNIVINGSSIGQIAIPYQSASGNYFLRAGTAYQYSQDTAGGYYAPLIVYNANGYQRLLHYRFTGPLPDSLLTEKYGIRLASVPTDDGIDCRVTAGKAFTRWGDTLYLRLKSGDKQAEYFPLVLTKKTPHARLDIKLAGIYGYLYLTLFYYHSVLAEERVNIPGPNADSVTLKMDSLNCSPQGVNQWEVNIADSGLRDVSVAVTDADKVEPALVTMMDQAGLIDSLAPQPPGTIKIDTNWLRLDGYAQTEKGKRMSVKDLAVDIHKDSNQYIFDLPIDSAGRFTIRKNILLTDSFHLDFQRNNHKSNQYDVRLAVYNRNPPPLNIPCWFRREDSSALKEKEDTAVIFAGDSAYQQLRKGFNQVKLLKAAIVKANSNRVWDNRRHQLNEKYAPGTPITPWFYDLVHDDADSYASTILDYLSRHQPGFTYELDSSIPHPKLMGKPVYIFIDGVQIQTWELANAQLRDVALIKVDNDYMGPVDTFEREMDKMIEANQPKSPVPPPPTGKSSSPPKLKLISSDGPDLDGYAAIMMYTRHPEDWKFLPSFLHEITIPGFAKAIPFNSSADSRWTLFWNPHASNPVKIRFRNNGYTRHFRLHIEGIDEQGNRVEYEKLIGD